MSLCRQEPGSSSTSEEQQQAPEGAGQRPSGGTAAAAGPRRGQATSAKGGPASKLHDSVTAVRSETLRRKLLMPTKAQREAAAKLKEEGNSLFQRSK